MAGGPSTGFSLIETVVSVAIIVFAVVGPLTAAQKSLASASYSKDQVIATYLAQEAIEFVQYKRSQNIIDKKEWLAELRNVCVGQSGGSDIYCGFDPTGPNNGNQVIACDSGNNGDCVLYYDKNTGIFSHRTSSGWSKTKFRRKIHIREVVKDREIAVSASVFWQASGFKESSFTATDYLLNWKIQK